MSKKGKTLHHRLISGFLLVSSFVLLGIGSPRFLAELMLIPGTPIYENISDGKKVNDEALNTLEQSRVKAISFFSLPRAHTSLGALYLIRAQRAKTTKIRKHFALQSIKETSVGLEHAPLNTFAWTRLSVANVLLGKPYHKPALEAWRMSIITARVEPHLFLERVHLGMTLYHIMNPQDINFLNEQFKLAYYLDRNKLWNYAQQYSLTVWLVFLAQVKPDILAYYKNKMLNSN